jgi:hypothetical protein
VTLVRDLFSKEITNFYSTYTTRNIARETEEQGFKLTFV